MLSAIPELIASIARAFGDRWDIYKLPDDELL